MIRTGFGFRSAVCAALLSATAAFTQQAASAPAGPIPPAILAAQKIFVSNAGGDSGLFPSPFSGDPDRAYTEFYADLKTTGLYELVADPSDADLVLELQLIAPSGPARDRDVNKVNGATDPMPMFRLVIYDRKTHFVLWTMTQSIGIAYTQKTHDHNFDAAITVLIQKYEQLIGKPITPFK